MKPLLKSLASMRFRSLFLPLTLVALALFSCENSPVEKTDTPGTSAGQPQFTAAYGTPTIDGLGADETWASAEWLPLNQVWVGTPPTPEDFTGRYKLAWDENNVYLLAEITDDTLVDTHPDGLLRYWDDDCLEIFVDEDATGGNHQYSHNAFAYHIALDGKVVDIAADSSFQYYNDHCTMRRTTQGNTTTWEVAMKIFDGNKYVDGGDNIPKLLQTGKKMGFMLAYCDNDRSAERENFVGNVVIAGKDKNRGFIDASIFGILELK